jgi:biopolymer transport protein ExbD
MPKLETLPNAPGRMGARRARTARVSSSLAEINVVPLIDVMLVLLVVFMVTAPMMQQGFGVHLPQSRNAPAAKTEEVSVVIPASFHRDSRIQLNGEFVRLDVLTERIRQALDGKLNKDVTIACEGSVTMNEWALVSDKLIEAGVTKVGMLTQQPGGDHQP